MQNEAIIEATARTLWETYRQAVGGRAMNGDPLPDWPALVSDTAKTTVVAAWRASAKAALGEVFLRALNTLNGAYAADPAAMHALVCNRVPCIVTLADHPTIIVDSNKSTPIETYAVGLLGILNGIMEAATGARIAAAFSTPDEVGRCRLLHFTEYLAIPEQSEALSEQHKRVG